MANELGAGNLVAAKASAFVAIMIAAVESSSVSFALFMSSNIWGYAYSNVPEVIHYAAEITGSLHFHCHGQLVSFTNRFGIHTI